MLNKVANKWNKLFSKHPWIEAFSISILFHVALFIAICSLYDFTKQFFPKTIKEKIIEIEFIMPTS